MMREKQMSDRTGRKSCIGIGLKIGCVMAVMQIFFVVMAVTICVYMFRDLITRMQEERCVNGTDMLAYELIRVSEDEDINQILDEMKQRMGCEFTIFEGDTRAYTTVIQDGKRVVGTKLSSSLSSTILQQGQTYLGKATILDEEYLCSYVPTRDADGKVDGLIFAGTPPAPRPTDRPFMTVIMSSLVSVGVIIVCIMIMTPYLKKTVSNPLAEITQVADRLAHGDLGLTSGEDIQISVHSNDEVGDLAQIFRETIHRLRSYIGEISSVLESVADGDLTPQITQEYIGDFASIRTSVNNIIQKLNTTIGQIVASSEHVANGADQMSTASQALSQGSMEQTGAVEELEETIRSVTGSVKQTAQNVQRAREQVGGMGGQLAEGNQRMQEMIAAMGEITDSSNEIEKIIK